MAPNGSETRPHNPAMVAAVTRLLLAAVLLLLLRDKAVATGSSNDNAQQHVTCFDRVFTYQRCCVALDPLCRPQEQSRADGLVFLLYCCSPTQRALLVHDWPAHLGNAMIVVAEASFLSLVLRRSLLLPVQAELFEETLTDLQRLYNVPVQLPGVVGPPVGGGTKAVVDLVEFFEKPFQHDEDAASDDAAFRRKVLEVMFTAAAASPQQEDVKMIGGSSGPRVGTSTPTMTDDPQLLRKRVPRHRFGQSFFHLNCPHLHLSDAPGGSGRDGPFRFVLPTDGDEALFTVFSEFYLGLYHDQGLETIADLHANGKLQAEQPRYELGADGADGAGVDVESLEVHYSVMQDRYLGRYKMSLAALGEDHIRQMDAAALRRRARAAPESEEEGWKKAAGSDRCMSEVADLRQTRTADAQRTAEAGKRQSLESSGGNFYERSGSDRNRLEAGVLRYFTDRVLAASANEKSEFEQTSDAETRPHSQEGAQTDASIRSMIQEMAAFLGSVSKLQLRDLHEFLILNVPPPRKLLPRLVRPFLETRCGAPDFASVDAFIADRVSVTTALGLDGRKHRATLADLVTHVRPCAMDYLQSQLLQSAKCVNWRQIFMTVGWSRAHGNSDYQTMFHRFFWKNILERYVVLPLLADEGGVAGARETEKTEEVFLSALRKRKLVAVHLRIAFGVRPWQDVLEIADRVKSSMIFVATDNPRDPGVLAFIRTLESHSVGGQKVQVFTSADTEQMLRRRAAGFGKRHEHENDDREDSKLGDAAASQSETRTAPSFDTRGKLPDLALLLDIVVCVLARSFLGSPYSSLSQLVAKFRLHVREMYTTKRKTGTASSDSVAARSTSTSTAQAHCLGSHEANVVRGRIDAYDYYAKNSERERGLLGPFYTSMFQNEGAEVAGGSDFFADGPGTVHDVFPLEFYAEDVWSWLWNLGSEMIRAATLSREHAGRVPKHEDHDDDAQQRSGPAQPTAATRESKPQWFREALIVKRELDFTRLAEKHYVAVVAGTYLPGAEKVGVNLGDLANLYPCETDDISGLLPVRAQFPAKDEDDPSSSRLPACRETGWHEWSDAELQVATQFFDYGTRTKTCLRAAWLLRLRFLLFFFLQANYREEECRHNLAAFGYLTWKLFFGTHEETLYKLAEIQRKNALPLLNFLFQFARKTRCRGQVIADVGAVLEAVAQQRAGSVQRGRPRLVEEDQTHVLKFRELVAGSGTANNKHDEHEAHLFYVSPAATCARNATIGRTYNCSAGVTPVESATQDGVIDVPPTEVDAVAAIEFLVLRDVARTRLQQAAKKRPRSHTTRTAKDYSDRSFEVEDFFRLEFDFAALEVWFSVWIADAAVREEDPGSRPNALGGRQIFRALYAKILSAPASAKQRKYSGVEVVDGGEKMSTPQPRDEEVAEPEELYFTAADLFRVKVVQRLVIALFHHPEVDTGSAVWREILHLKQNIHKDPNVRFGMHCKLATDA
eukprot:g14138.t1